MGSENDNGTITRSCKDCLWGDKCRDMEHKAFSLADIPCEDYWEIDEDAEVERIMEIDDSSRAQNAKRHYRCMERFARVLQRTDRGLLTSVFGENRGARKELT